MHTPADRPALIAKIRELPSQLEALVHGMTDAQLDFRPGPREWSTRQIVHHVADSHMNAFTRMKLALTEPHPTIKPYDQELFAELPDTTAARLEDSLAILRGLHARWVILMVSLTDEQWARTAFHPEHSSDISPDTLLETYADHGEIHLRQIAEARRAQGVE